VKALKRACQVEGCRAWAMRGEVLCSAHQRAHALRASAEHIQPLLRALAEADPALPLDNLELIDNELRRILRARDYCLAWLEEVRADKAHKPPLNPTQFLRAWGDSTARIAQLVRARRELTGHARSEADALIASVYERLEARLPDKD
jgi:hypothetical protein